MKAFTQKFAQFIKPLCRTYAYDVPQHKWHLQYPIAKNGRRQSPINLVLNDPDIAVRKTYKNPLKFNYHNDDINLVTNNGSSVTFFADEKATVEGGPLKGDTYKMVQFHFHWGAHSNCGSEHLVNGRQYSGEVHIVHQNTKYPTFDEALEKGDGLCVVGALMDAQNGHHCPKYQKVVDQLSKVHSKGFNCEIDLDFNCTQLLPGNLDNFAYYKGSLTTPPLNECVQWIVMLDPVKIGESQMQGFRELRGHGDEKILNNYRWVQSMYGRKITHSCCCCGGK